MFVVVSSLRDWEFYYERDILGVSSPVLWLLIWTFEVLQVRESK